MVRIDDSGTHTKCWLDYPEEVDALAEAAREVSLERAANIWLMGHIGCRASGVPSARPAGVAYNDDGDYWEMEILGKNTEGGAKKTRDAFLPRRIKDKLDIYGDDLGEDEPYVDASVPSIRRWVKEAAERMAEKTGNERWLSVSSHDLRRSWATYHLVERDVPVRVMMEIGGWSSYEAIEPYLTKPTPATIGREMAEAEAF